MNVLDINIVSIDKTIADKAAQIRAEYRYFKAMDAFASPSYIHQHPALFHLVLQNYPSQLPFLSSLLDNQAV